MLEHVEQSLQELREGMPGHDVRVLEDGSGGAYVIVDEIEIGEHFAPPRSWIGFHVTFAEDADVYPHFIDPTVRYVGTPASAPNQHPDGNLPTAMTRGQQMPGFLGAPGCSHASSTPRLTASTSCPAAGAIACSPRASSAKRFATAATRSSSISLSTTTAGGTTSSSVSRTIAHTSAAIRRSSTSQADRSAHSCWPRTRSL